ncbi:MAG: 3-deoxy-7-phosphoheptulonate synthase [Candidatus Woesearchaeota archaeon]|nr:3-deoxy-7-phosphoheptulonate synthase [Candidatus Woesearchaeota archaeon]
MTKVTDENIASYDVIIPPMLLKKELPLTKETEIFVKKLRREIQDIITGKDKRKLVICGPCSIHDIDSAIDYAKKLSMLAKKLEDKFLIIMRTYFEKPRTSVGWKGILNDPNLDGSHDINHGLRVARKLLLDINDLKIGCATEFLEPFTPQFIDDLISYAAIGARTTESPTHRQLASGLSVPVGFKNTLSGDVKAAVNAIEAANHNQTFLGMNDHGYVSNVFTKGNKYAHLILRGGKDPNYDKESVESAHRLLKESKLCESIIIDCSHGNSNKDHKNQARVFEEFIRLGEQHKELIGVMIESNLSEGSQRIPNKMDGFDKKTLRYGVSVTDSCIGFEETEKILVKGHGELR